MVIRAPSVSDPRTDPVQAILNASGVRARRVVLAGEWWKFESGPLLGFFEDSKKPVALIPVSRAMLQGTRYELFNPAENSRTVVNDQIAATLSGAAVTLYRPLSEEVTPLSTLKFVLEGRTTDLIIIILTGIAATLLGMLTPQATAILVDQAIPDGNRSMILQIGLGLFTAALGSMLFEFAQSASLLRIEIGSSSILQCGVWDRLLKLSPAFFRGYTTGDLASRADAINQIRQQLSGATLRTIFIGVTSLLNLFLMFYYSPALALAALVLVLLVVAVTSSCGVLITQFVRRLQEMQGDLYGLVVQLVNGAGKLQIAAAEERAFAHWGRLYSRQQKLKQTIQKLQDRVRLVNFALPALSSALMFLLVEDLLRQPDGARMALGTFLAFSAAFGTFFAGVTSLSDTGIGLLNVSNLWKRARVILDAPPEVDKTKAHPGKLKGRVSVEHVTFRYRQDGPLILDDVSIEVGPGESIALVGPSASGKSTILSLLLRFESPISGAIYYDGQNLDSLDVAAVRRQLGVVLQENKITAGSLYENIVCGSLCTLEDAWEAARAAAFDVDIESMPMKMHTPISEGGANISGGQRQRLLIARALVTKPSILIFDEATSALDNRTQAIVTASLRQLKVTTILVAHRLSTIQHADRIYVIEAGRVVQSGKFQELARQDGLFARLMARQMV
jgi:NHLM bacteriocin system ABC transporter ATP-binding protein